MSDGSGLGASWHLDQVEVTDTVRGITVAFPCGEWLDPSDPMSLTKVLFPRGVEGAKGSLLQYEVTVYTSDTRGAGTDSNVSIELIGDKVCGIGYFQLAVTDSCAMCMGMATSWSS